MPKDLKKFRKKGLTFDKEFSEIEKSRKPKNKRPKLKPINYQKNFNPKNLLEEEEE
jgi:hypothetical protein